MTNGTETVATPTPAPEAPPPKNWVVSWEFAVLNLLLVVLCFVVLQKPTGSIGGQIAMEQEGFNLYHYDMKGNKVYVLAIGPRGANSDERGVWVQNDGSFRLDSLPVGEYSLKVHVPGFASTWENGVFVEDGKMTKLKDPVLLALAEPTVNIASHRRVFSTQEKPTFWINTSGCNEATVRVYNKDVLGLLKKENYKKENFEISNSLGVWKSYNRKANVIPFEKTKPVKEFHRKINAGEDSYDRQDFAFDQPLPPGDYFAIAECSNVRDKSDWSIIWFSVSDVGLIVKQDPEKALVRAINLNTMKPIAGAHIDLLDGNANTYEKFAGGVTAGDGFTSISMPADKRNIDSQQILVYGTFGTSHAYGGLSFYNNANGDEQTYFYTDRPIYRLGQTVYFKGIVRKREATGFKNPGAETVQVTIEDPDNNALWNHDIKTNSHGTFNGSFDVPKDGKTGGYQVTIHYPDGETQYERFEVGQYRKPEYLVEVIPLEQSVISGSKAKAKIRAKYYFGAPVTNAKIDYSVYERPDYNLAYSLMYRPEYYSYFDGWDDESGYYDSYYSGDFVTSGTAQTDENGEATIEFGTAKTNLDLNDPAAYEYGIKRYKIETTVTDISRIGVESSGTLNAVPGDFALFVEPSNYVVKVGENVRVDFNAVTYEKQPVKNQEVRLQLVRRKVDQDGNYKGFEVADEIRATTDDEGRGTATFNAKPEFVTDLFYIVGRTHDRSGHDIMASRSIWVYDANDPWAISDSAASAEPLSIKLDKAAYLPGETAKIMITAPVKRDSKGPSEAIISIEGAKIYSYKLVKLSAAAEMIELPITDDYAPNVYVAATFVDAKRNFYHQEKMLKVSPQNRFLDVKVATDKNRYKPGEKITYTITALDNKGKPAADTEVSLGVVDESIYAVRADMTPDIKRYFYSKRENRVQTLCTFPEENSGGPDKIEPRVRKDFKDTAAWFPNLVTNKDGIATASFTLPDNLTTWRATVRGVNMQTDVGWTLSKVISTQDLVLRLALPRFFTQGDESFLTAVVHNYTDQPQSVNLTLTPSSQFQLGSGLVQKVDIKPDGVTRYSWPIKVVSAGDATVRVKAVGQTAADAMEMKVPVRALGIPMMVAKGGFTEQESAVITIPVPHADAAPGSANYKVCVSSSAFGPIIGNFSSLIDYPYGCTEQTMSKLMPSVVAMRMHQALGAPLTKADIDKFQKVYKKGMEKLDGYQHSDGGWGWWENDDSNPYLTSLVMEGYYLLREAGYHVDAGRAANGKKWLQTHIVGLKQQLADPKLVKTLYWSNSEQHTDLSRAAYALSLYKAKIPADITAFAASNRMTYGPVPLAYWTLAAKQSGDLANAKLFYDRLVELSNDIADADAGRLVSWEKTDAMDKKMKSTNEWYDQWRYTGVETTALGLRAAVVMEPNNRDRIEAVKRWILVQRGKDGFGNTKTTSQVFVAMMNDEIANKPATEGEYKLEVLKGENSANNTSVLQTFAFNKDSRFQPEQVLKADLDSSVKAITIKKTGPGRLYYSTVLNYSRVLKPGQQIADGTPKGLKLKRQFFRLQANVDSEGKTHFRATPISDNRVKAGETLLMKVFVETPTRIPYLMAEAALPSGAEVVKNDSAEDRLEEEGSNNEIETSNFWSSWWTHQDILDDRMSFFVTSLSSGKYEFHTMVRLELPGKYELNPVLLEGMYTSGIRGYSNPDTITVTE